MKNKGYGVLDFETTGLDYREHEMTQFAVVLLDLNGNIESKHESLVKIDREEISDFITDLTGITKEDTETGISKKKAKRVLKKLLKGRTLIIQNAPFDLSYLETITGNAYDFIDISAISLVEYPNEKAKLDAQAARFGFEFKHHDALEDAEVTTKIFNKYAKSVDMNEFVNRLIVRPDRPMFRIPSKASRIDILIDGKLGSILKDGR